MAIPNAHAQIDSRIAPRQPEERPIATLQTPGTPEAFSTAEPLIPQLFGIVFVTSADAVDAAGTKSNGISADGLPILQTGSFRDRVGKFFGKPLTLSVLKQITDAVVLAYAAAGRPVVDAIVPEQDITPGTVQIVVIEGRVGKVRTEGNKHFDSDRLLAMMRSAPRGLIKRDELLADVDFINRNPFRSTDVIFERGEKTGETDIVVRVHDQAPFRLYAGYENSGNNATSEHRLFTGFNWGNAFGLDHRLGYQFTSAPDLEKFSAHSASYAIPLPWHHEIRIYGSYSESLPSLAATTGTSSAANTPTLQGRNVQASLRYEIPMARFAWELPNHLPVGLSHSFVLGADYKRANNNLEFGGEQVFDRVLDVAELSAGYSARETDALGTTSLEATLYYSPGNITGANTAEKYQSARPGADSDFACMRISVDRQTRLPGGCTWTAALQAQFASGKLISMEQIGFGGRGHVRGYAEYSHTADTGFILENEVQSPAIAPLFNAGLLTERDSLRIAAFYDYGQGYLRGDLAPGEERVATFSAIGIGLRYSLSSYFQIQYDYAIPLINNADSDSNGHHHFTATFSLNF